MDDGKIFILQKDLPNAKAGMRFLERITLHGFGGYTADSGPSGKWIHFNQDEVEDNPEWFLPEEEKKEPDSDEDQIKKARALLEKHGYGVSDRCPGYPSPSIMYSESDLQDAFVAARRTYFCEFTQTTKMSFNDKNDYLKSLNK